jgi:SSS family solute:Na+ symporter
MQSSTFSSLDTFVFFVYFIIVAGYGFWVYKRKQRSASASHDYFLAEGSLTWWAIGASMIASNISASTRCPSFSNSVTAAPLPP